MFKNNVLHISIVISLLFVQACSYEFPVSPEDPEISLGSADFEQMVVIGSDISAGYMDGALYEEGQTYAYSALLGMLIEQETGMNIYEDLSINGENGFNIEAASVTGGTPGRYVLSYRSPSTEWPFRKSLTGSEVSDFTGNLSEINNFSLPGLKSYQFEDATALSENPYFTRLSNRPANAGILDIALSGNPTIVIMEPGFTDIFDYALNGASGAHNSDPKSIGKNDQTPVSVFEENLDKTLNRTLDETDADIFLLTIPDPLMLPYFTQLLWYYPSDEWEFVRSNLNFSHYSQFNIWVQNYNEGKSTEERRPIIVFDNLGSDEFRAKVIFDDLLPDAQTSDGTVIPKYRQMTPDDYFLYNAEKLHHESVTESSDFGRETPIDDRYVITKGEAEIITERRNAFNSAIKAAASAHDNIHLVDFGNMIERIYEGELLFEGGTFTLDFESSSMISADGYTLNPRGQALLANRLIEVLNNVYGASLPALNVNHYRGNDYDLEF